MSENEFLSGWRSWLAEGTPGLRLAGVDHPLEIFAGANDLGAPKLTIQTKEKPKVPALSHLVLVDRRDGQAGYWNLTLTLQDVKFQEVFLRLVDDLFTRSGEAATEEQALRIVDVVFDEWRRLLSPRPPGVLSREELRGLVGEIWLVINRFFEQQPIDETIAGWLGPLSAHQDFFYEASGLHEAKSIGPAMSAVKVSSEFQLDPLGETLQLVVMKIADVTEGAVGAVSLVTLHSQVKKLLDSASSTYDELDARFAHLGVDLTQRYYADTWFAVVSVSDYAVTADFPAVRASQLPPGIKRVKYQIDLAAIEPFKTNFESLQ